jgi:hypothetical protein
MLSNRQSKEGLFLFEPHIGDVTGGWRILHLKKMLACHGFQVNED